MTRVVVDPVAVKDLQDIIADYLSESGVNLADRFQKAWARTTRHLEEFPASGSPRLSIKVGIPNLRVWPVPGFPHVAAYIVSTEVTTVIRVLHTSRDIPTSLRD